MRITSTVVDFWRIAFTCRITRIYGGAPLLFAAVRTVFRRSGRYWYPGGRSLVIISHPFRRRAHSVRCALVERSSRTLNTWRFFAVERTAGVGTLAFCSLSRSCALRAWLSLLLCCLCVCVYKPPGYGALARAKGNWLSGAHHFDRTHVSRARLQP